VRRDAIERVILGGVRRDLLAPERVERMAAEMRIAYAARMRKIAARAETLPREIQELDARITRLRERLKAGDPASAAKARTILRQMLGEIMLSPGEDGSLWAEYAMQPAALLQGAGTCGRGDRIWSCGWRSNGSERLSRAAGGQLSNAGGTSRDTGRAR
jgi:hypothetical protein